MFFSKLNKSYKTVKRFSSDADKLKESNGKLEKCMEQLTNECEEFQKKMDAIADSLLESLSDMKKENEEYQKEIREHTDSCAERMTKMEEENLKHNKVIMDREDAFKTMVENTDIEYKKLQQDIHDRNENLRRESKEYFDVLQKKICGDIKRNESKVETFQKKMDGMTERLRNAFDPRNIMN